MIKRIVELILDPESAKRLEAEMKKALREGTDPKQPEKNLSLVERSVLRLKRAALGLGATLAAAFGARAMFRFGKESVQAAVESEVAWSRLADQLATTGTRFEDVEAQIRSAADAMQLTTTLGDEEFAGVLTELVGITGNYAASLAEVRTVADLAAAKQIDMSTAAKLVGRAMIGQTDTLSRYGIVVSEGADAMDVLRERFAGMAEGEGATLSGRLTILSNQWGELKEAIGNALIEAGGGTSIIDTLTGSVRGLTTWVAENRSQIANWGQVVIRTFMAGYETVRFVARQITNAFDIVGTSVAKALLAIRQDFETSTNRAIELLNRIPGVDIEFRMNAMTPEEFAAAQLALTEEIKADTLDMQDAVLDLAEAYRDVGTAAAAAATGQERVAAGGGTVRDVADPFEVETRRVRPRTGAMRESDKDFRQRIVRQANLAAGDIRSDMEDTDLFAGLIEQVDFTAAYMREGFRGVGRAIVAQLIDGRAQEQFASGLAALASGTWPPNPLAIAAAGKHFLAAAAFKALGATIGGAMGGGGGSGGAGGFFPRGAIGSSAPGTRELPGSEVHIYIDPLSPSDARAQRFVAGASQNALERFGSNMKLVVHPASS